MRPPRDQRLRLRVRIAQVDQVHVVAVVRPFRRIDDQPAAIVRHFGRIAELRLVRTREDQPVLRLGTADAVEIDRLLLVQRLELLRRLRLRKRL
jgi:hypothetical protein